MKTQLVPIAIKGGASPGAIMQDEHSNTYIVKLGIPASSGPYSIGSKVDIKLLTDNMSRKSCEEKMFFELAQEIGADCYQLPETNIALLKPSDYESISPSIVGGVAAEYQEEPESIDNPKNVFATLRHKIKIPPYVEDINTQQALDIINSTDIVHFSSQLIDNYQDLAEFYNYHKDREITRSHKKDPEAPIPIEPRGMGAFFALSCCVGNNDSIGSQGKNAGFNPATNQIIVVDGGNANYSSNMISKLIPSSDNNSSWLSFDDDLSHSAQKEACETFIRFASLKERKLYNIITNNGKTAEILGEDYIHKQIIKFNQQQNQVIRVFYEEMIKHGCIIPEIVIQKKVLLDFKKHQSTILAPTKLYSTRENRSPNLDLKKSECPAVLAQDVKGNLSLILDLEFSSAVEDGVKAVPALPDNRPNTDINSTKRKLSRTIT